MFRQLRLCVPCGPSLCPFPWFHESCPLSSAADAIRNPALWVDCVPSVSGPPQTAVLSGESGRPWPGAVPAQAAGPCPSPQQPTGVRGHSSPIVMRPEPFLGLTSQMAVVLGHRSPGPCSVSWRGSSRRLRAGHDPSLQRASPWGPHAGGASFLSPPPPRHPRWLLPSGTREGVVRLRGSGCESEG